MSNLEKQLQQALERIAQLEAERNAAKLTMRISESGYVEVYGIPGKGRYSNSNTPEGWQALFNHADEILKYIEQNKAMCQAKLNKYRESRVSA